ncbi:MAG: AMP-binding protein, partial [Eubacteriales bacterium]|nr:AMP-binding protein [Eubacteriales bacterium]
MAKNVLESFRNKGYRVRNINDIRDLILQSARIYKKRNAFMVKAKSGELYNISYEKFCEDYTALTTALITHGATKDTRIAVIGVNSYEWSLSYIGAVTAGIVVPIDKELSESDIVNFIQAAECKAVFADSAVLDRIQPALAKTDILLVSLQESSDKDKYKFLYDLVREGAEKRSKGDKAFEDIKIDPYIMNVLIFTSGTTGSSKGVCLSHRNICANIMSVSKMVKVKSSEHVLSLLPLHHTYECTLGFLLIIYSGGCISYTDGLRYIAKNFNDYHISVVIAVPLLLEHMLKRIAHSVIKELPAKYKPKDEDADFSAVFKSLPFYIRLAVRIKVKNSLGGRLHLMIVGAAAANPATVETLDMLGFRTLQGYGLTECSP